MDLTNLYVLRYRRGVTGVQTGFIVASSNAKAEEVGHHYCNNLVNCRFIRVESAIIADESILPKLEQVEAPKAQRKAS